jgi:polyisoprenyl-phosphate glycosyltransferase
LTRLKSLTVVSVVKDVIVDSDTFKRFITTLEPHVTDFDFVLVANATNIDTTLRLKELVAEVPDTTVVFLGYNVHDDLARIVGIEHAVGDHILFCDMARDDPAVLPTLLVPLHGGHDLVIGDPPDSISPEHSFGFRLVFSVYARIYAAITNTWLALSPTGLRVLSREAALFISGRPNAELLLRARDIGPGFPATIVPLPPLVTLSRDTVRRYHPWSKGLAMLLSVSAMPLRGATYAALFGGGLSVVYSFYVCAVYMLKPDIAAGWTTISLQIAAMMFTFSLVLLFISEYVIQIHSSSPPRSHRYLVVRELRSTLSRRGGRLNIVDAEGRYQIGRPDWLLPADEAHD